MSVWQTEFYNDRKYLNHLLRIQIRVDVQEEVGNWKQYRSCWMNFDSNFHSISQSALSTHFRNDVCQNVDILILLYRMQGVRTNAHDKQVYLRTLPSTINNINGLSNIIGVPILIMKIHVYCVSILLEHIQGQDKYLSKKVCTSMQGRYVQGACRGKFLDQQNRFSQFFQYNGSYCLLTVIVIQLNK